MAEKRPLVLPVIHVQYLGRTLVNASTAFEAGCDGVFLISMDGHDHELESMAAIVKSTWPDKLVGINFLTRPADAAIHACAGAGLDMTWSDNAQVNTNQPLDKAYRIARTLQSYPGHQFFGGVAFKHQVFEPRPGNAAARAAALGLIPTTSGDGTGIAPEVAKIVEMHEALQGGPLALASGVTPDNVLSFAPYLSHILVSTGVSQNEYDFDFELLCQMMGKLNSTRTKAEPPCSPASI